VEITPGVFRWQLTLGIPYAEPDNEGLYYLIQKDFLTVAVGPQNFYLATFEVSDTQTLPLLNRNFAAIAAIVAALNLRPTGANSFTSYAALEAYDVGRLVLGDVVFVTIDDSTQIRQLQAGAPEGSDRSVLGTGTMRWRQTGGT
jgi:hypothetical protein